MFQARHGDVLITEVKELPKAHKKVKDGILLEGEVTGHAHRIKTGEFNLFLTKNGAMYLDVQSPSVPLTHEEHHTIEIPKGKYQVTRQREFDPYEEAARWVQD